MASSTSTSTGTTSKMQDAGVQASVGPASPAGDSPTSSTATTNNTAQSSSSSEDSSLRCQWSDCSESYKTPESLYDHICEKHVGRKSTNNLSLKCQWTGCHTTTVKRDHITSHIRVHVPLKPHKCDFCGKSFKRPQDLKKHVKTHAEDSMMSRQPEPSNQGLRGGGYGAAGAKGPSSYYDHTGQMRTNMVGFSHSPASNPSYYAHHHHPGTSSVPGVFYPNGMNTRSDFLSHQAPNDSRKRPNESLEGLFDSMKRRQFNLNSYSDVSRHLSPLHTTMAATMGAGALAVEYLAGPQTVSSVGGGSGGHGGPQPLPQQYYLPPPHHHPHHRSKAELQEIDRMLEQMQNTIYEAEHQLSPAGPPATSAAMSSSMAFRTTAMHPHAGHPVLDTAFTQGVPATIPSPHSASSAVGTPALTPASSGQYTPGASPASTTDSFSPLTRPNATVVTTAGLYPTLPPATTMYPTQSVASTIGPQMEAPRRFVPGGRLNAPSRPQLYSELEASRRPPIAPPAPPRRDSPPAPSSSQLPGARRSSSADSDGSSSSGSGSGGTIDEQAYDEWIDCIRLIENIRRLVKEEMRSADDRMEVDTPGPRSPIATDRSRPASLYPPLK